MCVWCLFIFTHVQACICVPSNACGFVCKPKLMTQAVSVHNRRDVTPGVHHSADVTSSTSARPINRKLSNFSLIFWRKLVIMFMLMAVEVLYGRGWDISRCTRPSELGQRRGSRRASIRGHLVTHFFVFHVALLVEEFVRMMWMGGFLGANRGRLCA